MKHGLMVLYSKSCAILSRTSRLDFVCMLCLILCHASCMVSFFDPLSKRFPSQESYIFMDNPTSICFCFLHPPDLSLQWLKPRQLIFQSRHLGLLCWQTISWLQRQILKQQLLSPRFTLIRLSSSKIHRLHLGKRRNKKMKSNLFSLLRDAEKRSGRGENYWVRYGFELTLLELDRLKTDRNLAKALYQQMLNFPIPHQGRLQLEAQS